MSPNLFNDETKTAIISMWRPWAYWVTLGWKSIESRTHERFKSLAGQRIGIHAAGKWDDEAIKAAFSYLTAEQIAETKRWKRNDVESALVCTVFVDEHRPLTVVDEPRALIECSKTKRFGLLLSDVQPIMPPRVMTGRQGIWRAFL